MRLWTLHPKYLDAQGLTALWREALLAQQVLRGKTKGYKHHPQLIRFRASRAPAGAIATYLSAVRREAAARGYRFDGRKIGRSRLAVKLTATEGQLLYEWRHLRAKLRARSPAAYRGLKSVERPQPHPLFRIVAGPVASWERVQRSRTAGSRRPRTPKPAHARKR